MEFFFFFVSLYLILPHLYIRLNIVLFRLYLLANFTGSNGCHMHWQNLYTVASTSITYSGKFHMQWQISHHTQWQIFIRSGKYHIRQQVLHVLL